MKIKRVWAMPNGETFSIHSIGTFVKSYLSGVVVDPFARNNGWATYSNDLNPDTDAKFHMEAIDFLLMLKKEAVLADVIIFDPPYSPRQISEIYQNIGLKPGIKETQKPGRWTDEKNIVDEILKPDGIFLQFGWNTCGMGEKRGYQIEEIMIVSHGAGHNDTLCLAERKVKRDLFT